MEPAPYMLLATSHGVPVRIIFWLLPQRFVDGCVLALLALELGNCACGRAAAEDSSATSATALHRFADIFTEQKSGEYTKMDALQRMKN